MVHYSKFGRKGYNRFKEGGKGLHKREIDKETAKVLPKEKLFEIKKDSTKKAQPENL